MALTDGDGNTVTPSPNFASGRKADTASVANCVVYTSCMIDRETQSPSRSPPA